MRALIFMLVILIFQSAFGEELSLKVVSHQKKFKVLFDGRGVVYNGNRTNYTRCTKSLLGTFEAYIRGALLDSSKVLSTNEIQNNQRYSHLQYSINGKRHLVKLSDEVAKSLISAPLKYKTAKLASELKCKKR